MTQGLIIILWLFICAMQDARQRQIANRLTLGVALLALIYLLWNGSTWLGASVSQGLGAFILALLFTLPGYALGRLGAGDVKLLAALGLATDPLIVLGSLVGSAGASVLWLIFAPRLWPLMGQGLKERLTHLAPGASTKLPFAPFLLIGFGCAWFWIH
ncbi:prepilin peptidase [Pseudomonas sp. CCM 7891]|uniref:Prepilin peptidase n=1 Tax=Pseudomonas karstica TaxID=1055468 RepID=A0A7X2RUK5_9PSED|nr:prepilin peptidase [Pseudomonas karstica]